MFSDACELKSIKLKDNSTNYVIYLSQLKATIAQLFTIQQDMLSPSKVDEIYNQLYDYSQADESVKFKHISSLK